jgi:hypothetical protein
MKKQYVCGPNDLNVIYMLEPGDICPCCRAHTLESKTGKRKGELGCRGWDDDCGLIWFPAEKFAFGSDEAHKTAIARTKLSAPARFLEDEGLLVGSCLDFGCGHGVDAEILGIAKWDPHFHPQITERHARQFDTIMCNYVLNVVTEEEAAGVLHAIEDWLKPGGHAYIAVRRDMKSADPFRQRLVELSLPVLTENAGFCIYETWR